VTTTTRGVGAGAAWETVALGGGVWPGRSWTYRVTCCTGIVSDITTVVDVGVATVAGARKAVARALAAASPPKPMARR
jgi:hypothetical protein